MNHLFLDILLSLFYNFLLFSMLFVNPMLKWHFNVSPTVKTQSDLARTAKVRELGIMFLTIYSAIIKNAKVNLDERIRSKAIVLNRQGIKPPVIQVS